jgi:hypothetical protein
VTVILALTIQSCAAIPTDESKAVRSIDDDSENNCKYLGFVSGEGPMGWTTAHAPEGAMNDVNNQAARLGGNAIRVINIDSSVATTVITADVYKCEFPE